MTRGTRSIFAGGGAVALSLCLLLAAGCNKGADTSNPPPVTPPSGSPPGAMGGPGGPGGPGRMGRGGPISENATGEQIYQQKCGCHGPEGKGGKAPMLTGGAGKSEEELVKIIHDGKGKMPAFSGQLSDDQIKKVAATVKAFK